MRIGKVMSRFTSASTVCLIGVVISASALQAQARASHDAHGNHDGPLVTVVRESTERFKNVAAAEAEGYAHQFGCVSGPDFGAMGLHYVNGPLLLDGQLDPTRPEALIYEPLSNGERKLVGVEYVVPTALWDATHPGAPEMMGQLFHLIEGPSRFGPQSLYALHVWAWKKNRKGVFVNWHPDVSCAPFNPGRD